MQLEPTNLSHFPLLIVIIAILPAGGRGLPLQCALIMHAAIFSDQMQPAPARTFRPPTPAGASCGLLLAKRTGWASPSTVARVDLDQEQGRPGARASRVTVGWTKRAKTEWNQQRRVL